MNVLSILKSIQLNTLDQYDYLKLGLAFGSTSIIGLLSYVTIKIYLNRRKYKHIPGPPNEGILGFYFGQAFDMLSHAQNGRPYAVKLTELVEKYGPVIKINLMSETFVHTVDYDSIKKILVVDNIDKDKKIFELLGFPIGERFLGNSMVIERDNEKWKKKRALFNQAFHRQELKTYIDEFNSTADVLIERLKLMADGKTVVNLYEEVARAAMDMISNVAFGLSLEAISDPNNKSSQYLKIIMKIMQSFFFNPFFFLNPKNWSKKQYFRKTLKDLRGFARQQILKRMEEIKNDDTVRNDILSFILKSQENQNIDLEDMIDEFITFFFAGHETTACALGFFFLEVARNFEVYEKLKAEIDSVIGSSPSILFEKLNDLEYTSCAFKETLRLYPPVTINGRYTSKPYKIGDYIIPENTWIAMSPFSSQHYSKSFPDPYKFDPERFQNTSIVNPYSYYPFSLGPRNCIGLTFAQIEAKVIIAKIIQNFNIILDPNQSFDIEESVTLKPKGGTRCFLTLRN